MDKEAAAIFEYLFSRSISQDVAAAYKRAVDIKQPAIDERDQKIWSKISESPFRIGLVDSYYALSKPQSGIRKRIQLVSAIAEATTDFTNDFLPQDRSVFYPIKIGLVGGRAIASFILGFLYCKVFV